MNKIVISNREPQQISIGGGGQVIGITEVLVNGVDVTVGSVAYVVVPTKTSQLQNDSGFITQETDPTIPYYIKQITQADINSWNSKQNQLVSGVNIKTINDNSILGSGNLDISTSYTAGTGIEITEENVINNTITSYNDLTDLPTIPTKTSDLLNDSDFVTSSELSTVATTGDYDDLLNKPTIPTQTSQLENNSGFITNNVDDLTYYYTKDYLYNLLPKVSDSGSNISLNNTYSSDLKIILSPSELSQDGTPTPSSPEDIHTISGSNTIRVDGKNLFDGAKEKIYFNSSKQFVTENNSKTTDYIPASEGDTFILTSQATSNGVVIASFDENYNCLLRSATSGTTITHTCPTGTKYIIGSNNNGMNTNTMLNKGSTALPYEPYNGDSYSVDLKGKNIFEPTANSQSLSSGGYLTKNDNGTYTVNNGDINFADLVILGTINVENGKTYYLYNEFSDTNNNLSLRRGSTMLVATSTNNVVSYTATTTETLNVYLRYQSSETYIYTPMVTINTAPTNFEKYYNWGEYCKIGNYSDRIFKNVEGDPDYDDTNLEVGLWYIKKNIGKIVLDGTQTCGYSNAFTAIYYANSTIANVGLNETTVMSNKAKGITINNLMTTNGIAQNTSSNRFLIKFDGVSSYNTEELIRQYFTSNNYEVYYVLATPTYTQIEGTLEDELEEISKAQSKTGQTNITQINNDLPFVISATTLKDISNL